LKAYIKWPLLIIALVALLLLLFLQLNLNSNKKPVSQNQVINKLSPGLPVRLKIPKINIDVSIKYVGFTSKREMDVPKNAADAGWFKLGPRPGEKGSAVIDGHFNKKNGEAGVFFNLYKLNKGDKLYVTDNNGRSITFVVREGRFYDPGLAGDVFSLNDGIAHLNLITCDGVWDGAKKSYSKRLVVFSDIVR
jgi:LPXTG-site transpeptidase (sortase) family protein